MNNEKLEYEYLIDEISAGEYMKNEKIKICDCPKWLENLGYDNLPVYYPAYHIEKAITPKSKNNIHFHGLDVDFMKNLPELISKSPVLAFDNPSRVDSMLVVLNAVDRDNLPIVMSIKPNVKNELVIEEIENNLILTLFGKDDYSRYFDSKINDDTLIYVDKKELSSLEEKLENKVLSNKIEFMSNVCLKKPACIENLEKYKNFCNEMKKLEESGKIEETTLHQPEEPITKIR